MNEFYPLVLLTITSFFTLINPLGTMPVFMTMTAQLSRARQKKIAAKAVFVSFIVILIFAFSGQVLFEFFGISINSFKIAGGIILLLIGQDMLQARLGKIKLSKEVGGVSIESTGHYKTYEVKITVRRDYESLRKEGLIDRIPLDE